MLVFRGAEVYPGDGPSFHADVGIADRRIAAIGELDGEVLDATGALLCPGFVDLHTHSALAPFDDPLLAPKILQGFTTEVICPDGLAPAPVDDWRARQAYLRALEGGGPQEWPWSSFAEYLDALDATRPALTLVPSVGHGAVRDFVVGGGRVPPRIDEMKHEVRLAFEAGARMLSFGLVYIPGAYADTDELVAVAEVAAEFGAPLVPHVRNEGSGVLEAVGEMIEVARRSGAPLHLSHLKSLDPSLLEPLLELVEDGRRDVRPVPVWRGVDAAGEPAAGVGAGGRGGGDACPCTRPFGAQADRARRRDRPARVGEPARHARAREHRRRRPDDRRARRRPCRDACSTCSSRRSSRRR